MLEVHPTSLLPTHTPRVFAELRSYTDPPPVVHQVIQAVLAIFYPTEDLQLWASCKPVSQSVHLCWQPTHISQ